MEQAHFRDIFKNASMNVCISTVGVFSDPLCPSPSSSSSVKIPANTEEGPDDPEPVDEADIQMKHSSD
jgi:hypothetical protein